MNISYLRKATGALVAPLVLLCGCGQTDGARGESQLSLSIVGSTGVQPNLDTELLAAVVTIDEIHLVPVSEQGSDAVSLLDEPATVPLTALPEAATELVNGVPIPPGRYSEIRCVVSGAYIHVVDQGVYATPDYDEVPWGHAIAGDLIMPSFEQSGLKIKLAESLVFEPGGPSTSWLLRFDVAESFGHPVGSGSWVMHPVIHATAADEAASIGMKVDTRSLQSGDKRLTVRLDDANNHSEAYVDVDGSTGYAVVQIPFLIPTEGPYQLKVTTHAGDAVLTQPPLPAQVPLTSGENYQIRARAIGIAP